MLDWLEGVPVEELVGASVGRKVVGGTEGSLVGDIVGVGIGLAVGFLKGVRVGRPDGTFVSTASLHAFRHTKGNSLKQSESRQKPSSSCSSILQQLHLQKIGNN